MPLPGHPIRAPRQEMPAVMTERDADDASPLSGWPCQGYPALCVPQLHRTIFGGGQKPRAIGAEERVRQGAGVADGNLLQLLGRYVPNPCRAVSASRQESLAVRAECDRDDLIRMFHRVTQGQPAVTAPESG